MSVAAPRRVQLPELKLETGAWPSVADIAHLFAAVPLLAPTEEVAALCVEAARRVLRCGCALAVPTRPVPLSVGDPREGLVQRIRFDAPGGEGELWLPPETEVPQEVLTALERHLTRVWQVQELRAGQALELDQLR